MRVRSFRANTYYTSYLTIINGLYMYIHHWCKQKGSLDLVSVIRAIFQTSTYHESNLKSGEIASARLTLVGMKLFSEKIETYLHFPTMKCCMFRLDPFTLQIKSIPWLLINWRRKGPEHQHPSNWPSYPEIFLFFTHNWMMLSGNRELIIALYILFRDSPRVDAWFVHGSRGYGLIYDDRCDCQFMSLSTGGDILRLRCYQMYLVLETVLRCSNTNCNYIISWTLSEQNIVLLAFTI